MRRGFTLIELLIVIGIIAILSTVVLLTLNPTELLKQSRDSTRIAELTSLDKAIGFASTQNPDLVLGAANTVYVSLPDTSATCATYVAFLPPLAPTWQYRCVTTANLRKLDGNGWLPINFTSLSIVPLDALAVDRSNNAQLGFYYTYAFQGTRWELNAQMESKKYEWNGSADVESTDGGNTIVLYEKGSNLNSMPKEVNARAFATILIPDSCADPSLVNALLIYEQKFYTRWTIPGSGKAALLRLWYRQLSAGEPGLGEVFEMAFYDDNPPGKRLSERVDVVALGTANSWTSSTLQTPVGINLGQTFIVGIGPDGENPSLFGNRVGRELGNCSGYEPNGAVTGSYYLSSGAGPLADAVGGTPIATPQYGLVGISYAPN